jgi:hypothetical protein
MKTMLDFATSLAGVVTLALGQFAGVAVAHLDMTSAVLVCA